MSRARRFMAVFAALAMACVAGVVNTAPAQAQWVSNYQYWTNAGQTNRIWFGGEVSDVTYCGFLNSLDCSDVSDFVAGVGREYGAYASNATTLHSQAYFSGVAISVSIPAGVSAQAGGNTCSSPDLGGSKYNVQIYYSGVMCKARGALTSATLGAHGGVRYGTTWDLKQISAGRSLFHF